MARASTTALSGLTRLAEERRQLDAREEELRAQAAVEIGAAMLAAGAEKIELKLLERIVRKVGEICEAEALKRLDARAA